MCAPGWFILLGVEGGENEWWCFFFLSVTGECLDMWIKLKSPGAHEVFSTLQPVSSVRSDQRLGVRVAFFASTSAWVERHIVVCQRAGQQMCILCSTCLDRTPQGIVVIQRLAILVCISFSPPGRTYRGVLLRSMIYFSVVCPSCIIVCECIGSCWLYRLWSPNIWNLLFPGLPFALAFYICRGAQTGCSLGARVTSSTSADPSSSRLTWYLRTDSENLVSKGLLMSSALVQQKPVQLSHL